MVRNCAKMPRIVEEAMSIIRSQRLSCNGGQWYFVRMRWTRIEVPEERDEVVVVVAIVAAFGSVVMC